MEKLRSIPKSKINRVRTFPSQSGLPFKQYGKSANINDYSEREISEMILGIYKDTKNLLVDGDYFVDLTKVTATKCVLETVSYYKRPTLDDYETNYHNRINNIRTFYVKDYFLITKDDVCGTREHRITKYLHKIGSLNHGRNDFHGFYSISNDHETLMSGKYPQDLFHPIKRYINGLFFNDDYRISEFIFESNLKIHAGQ